MFELIEKEFNPNIINSLNRMSQIVKDENEYLQKQVEKIYKEVDSYTKSYQSLKRENNQSDYRADCTYR